MFERRISINDAKRSDGVEEVGLRGDESIEVDELEPLKQRIGEFLLDKNAVRIDGQAGRPILDRTNYVKVGLTGIQLLDQPERLEISTAIVGVIITYLTDGIHKEVAVDWELFTDQIQQVPATATDPAGPLPTFLTPDDNVHTWTNFLKNYELPTVQVVAISGSLGVLSVPLVSLLCLALLVPSGWQVSKRARNGGSLRLPIVVVTALVVTGVSSLPYARVSIARPAAIAGVLDDQQATALLELLLKNVYRAFDFREEEDVYDKLAISVTGDLLANVYLENRRSFAVQGARKPGSRKSTFRTRARSVSMATRSRMPCGADGRPWARSDTGATCTRARIFMMPSSRSKPSMGRGRSPTWK